MGRISRQIGWSQEANLLYYIYQKIVQLTKVAGSGGTTTSTTTSTSTSTTTSTSTSTTTSTTTVP